MQKTENVYHMDSATYEIERVFTSDRAPRDVVIEEIITTANHDRKITHSMKKVI